MANALDALPEGERGKLRKAKQPSWTVPMLATLTDERFSSSAWLYEPKLDGERCLAFIESGHARLMSRNEKQINRYYPELAEALENRKLPDCVLDGEIVAFAGRVSSFQMLQARMQASRASGSRVRVHYYIFDLIFLDGYSLEAVGVKARKAVLEALIDFSDPIHFTRHRTTRGIEYYEDACAKGWEGLVVKRADSPYHHGRSPDWLKFKCVHEQEFVVGGYTEPHGSRRGFGALLVGYYEGVEFLYAGKVGTGFDDKTLEDLHGRMSALERKTSPFGGEGAPDREVHWVKPQLVCEVGFAEWTGMGHLRHPRYLGLRRDKAAREVVRETPG